jgi:hypothetical protein
METKDTSASLTIELQAATTPEVIAAIAGRGITALAASETALASTQASLETANTTVTASLEQVAELGKRLDVLEKNKAGGAVIATVDGKDYKIIGNRFLIKGNAEPVTAEQLSQNEDQLRLMVSKGSGALILVADNTAAATV